MPLGLNPQFSRWNISDEDLENGIKIESKDKLKLVTISRDILRTEGSQEISSLEKCLFYPVVQFITENGTNRSIIESILQNRYGIYIPSYASLTGRGVNKTSERYSDFENDDLILIISDNIKLERYLIVRLIKDVRIPASFQVLKFPQTRVKPNTDMPQNTHHQRDITHLEKLEDVSHTHKTTVKNQNRALVML